jgi:hypothetical protein
VTPNFVCYTGLEFDPGPLLQERCIKGVIPPDWQRHRFIIDVYAAYPVGKLNSWLRDNIEGSWAIYSGFVGTNRQVTIAFEHDFDAMTFVMADGKTQAFKE